MGIEIATEDEIREFLGDLVKNRDFCAWCERSHVVASNASAFLHGHRGVPKDVLRAIDMSWQYVRFHYDEEGESAEIVPIEEIHSFIGMLREARDISAWARSRDVPPQAVFGFVRKEQGNPPASLLRGMGLQRLIIRETRGRTVRNT